VPFRVHEVAPADGYPESSMAYAPLQHVRVLVISFLQGLFQTAPPGCYHWDEDETTTEIVIRDENPINVASVNARPAINLTMGAVQFYSMGLGDLLHYDPRTGRQVRSSLVPGSLTVNVSARSDIVAHNLAWVIAEHVWLFRDEFLRRGFFEIGQNVQVSPPSSASAVIQQDSGDEWYVSSVGVPYQFYRTSATTPLSQRIVQNIRTQLSTNLQTVESLGVPAAATHEYPVHQEHCFPPSFAPGASDVYGATPDPAGTREVFLPKQPHPLNPAQRVTVRFPYPHRAGLRGPSMGGRALPLVRSCVKESGT